MLFYVLRDLNKISNILVKNYIYDQSDIYNSYLKINKFNFQKKT